MSTAYDEHTHVPDDAQVVDLDEWLDQQDGEGIDYDSEPHAVEDRDRANYLLGRLGRVQHAQAADEALVAAEKAKLDEWLTMRTNARTRQLTWLHNALEGFMLVESMRNGSRSVTLPNGKLALRAPVARVVVTDGFAFERWAESNAPGMLRVRIEPDKVHIKEDTTPGEFITRLDEPEVAQAPVVNEDGEVLPGIAYERNTAPTFSVTVAK